MFLPDIFTSISEFFSVFFFSKFPTKNPIKMLGHGAFKQEAHNDEKQKYFFSLSHTLFLSHIDVSYAAVIYSKTHLLSFDMIAQCLWYFGDVC